MSRQPQPPKPEVTIALVGPRGGGKTSLMNRFVTDAGLKPSTTPSADKAGKVVTSVFRAGVQYRINDGDPRETYADRGLRMWAADITLLVFGVDQPAQFDEIPAIYNQLKHVKGDDIKVAAMLVGTRTNLAVAKKSNDIVTWDRANGFAAPRSMMYIETDTLDQSTQCDENVRSIFWNAALAASLDSPLGDYPYRQPLKILGVTVRAGGHYCPAQKPEPPLVQAPFLYSPEMSDTTVTDLTSLTLIIHSGSELHQTSRSAIHRRFLCFLRPELLAQQPAALAAKERKPIQICFPYSGTFTNLEISALANLVNMLSHKGMRSAPSIPLGTREFCLFACPDLLAAVQARLWVDVPERESKWITFPHFLLDSWRPVTIAEPWTLRVADGGVDLQFDGERMAAESEYFKRLRRGGWKEGAGRRVVELGDMSVVAGKALVAFLSGRKAGERWWEVRKCVALVELWQWAQRLQMPDLWNATCYALAQEAHGGDALCILALASSRHLSAYPLEKELKHRVVYEEWDEVVKAFPTLASQPGKPREATPLELSPAIELSARDVHFLQKEKEAWKEQQDMYSLELRRFEKAKRLDRALRKSRRTVRVARWLRLV